MKKWREKKKSHELHLRKKMALSFGNFEQEGLARDVLVAAIRACDESKIREISVPGYDRLQTEEILRRYGVFKYTTEQIAERRAVIENQLYRTMPGENLGPVKKEIFEALRGAKVEVKLGVEPLYVEKIRNSGLADFMDLDVH
jgi:hypothetical protein